jgi:hypothetical protein
VRGRGVRRSGGCLGGCGLGGLLLGWDGLGGAWGVLDAGIGLGGLRGRSGRRDDTGLRGSGRVLDARFVLDPVLGFVGLLDLLIGDLGGSLRLRLLLDEETLVGGFLLGGTHGIGWGGRRGFQGDGGDGGGGRGGTLGAAATPFGLGGFGCSGGLRGGGLWG